LPIQKSLSGLVRLCASDDKFRAGFLYER